MRSLEDGSHDDIDDRQKQTGNTGGLHVLHLEIADEFIGDDQDKHIEDKERGGGQGQQVYADQHRDGRQAIPESEVDIARARPHGRDDTAVDKSDDAREAGAFHQIQIRFPFFLFSLLLFLFRRQINKKF